MTYMLSAIIIGGAVGAIAEYLGFVRNGYVVSVVMAIGGAIALFFLQRILEFNIGFGRAATSAIGAVVILALSKLRR